MSSATKSRTRRVEAGGGVPVGLYIAEVKAIEDGVESQFDGKEQVKFFFRIVEVLDIDPEWDDPETVIDEEQWAWANDYVSEGSKLFRWARAILGGELEVGDEFDLDDLLGRRCKLTVALNKNDKLTVPQDGVAIYKEPKRGKKRSKKPEPEPEVEDDDDEDEVEDF